MKTLIKTLALTAAGLVVGAVVVKRVKKTESVDVFINGKHLTSLLGNHD